MGSSHKTLKCNICLETDNVGYSRIYIQTSHSLYYVSQFIVLFYIDLTHIEFADHWGIIFVEKNKQPLDTHHIPISLYECIVQEEVHKQIECQFLIIDKNCEELYHG